MEARPITRFCLFAIDQHGADFLNSRLASANPKNDTKQTPYKGHPIYMFGVGPNAANLREIAVLSNPYGFRV
jgi:hypothetical protein